MIVITYRLLHTNHTLIIILFSCCPRSKSVAVPAVIAIDCEMCETADPVTGAKDTNSLVRFSVINGFKPTEVLLDTLVAPNMPITEIRSHIHGITEEQLKTTNFTLRQAQAFLYQNCSEDTIIVGHSVHNDLKALRFNHMNVIDTAYLYALENEPNAAASVRDISEQVLGEWSVLLCGLCC